MLSLSSIVVFMLAIIASHAVRADVNDVPLPDINFDEYWGSKDAENKIDTSIKPFRIRFPEEMVNNLKYRLNNHRICTSPLKDANFTYGTNLDVLRVWAKYWVEKYPFAKREKFLNQFPQYTTEIQGLKIHFLRVLSKNKANKQVVPVLLLHGWPGSVREFYETITFMLKYSESRNFALDIIVPSLPGYGFSEGTSIQGLGLDKVAVVFRNLMHRIGHKKYCVQGGDLGSFIAINMATFFPNEVQGLHVNGILTHTPETLFSLVLGASNPETVARPEVIDRIYPLSTYLANLTEETGYLHIQATRPDTVGVGVSDSPIGLASYVIDKFSSFNSRENKYYPDGGITAIFSREQILDNLMIYWTSNCMITAMRMYAETFNKRYFGLNLNEIVSPVPTVVVQAKGELVYMPPWMIKKKFPNLLYETVIPDGGHFVALGKPDFFARSVLDAIDAFRKWHSAQYSTVHKDL